MASKSWTGPSYFWTSIRFPPNSNILVHFCRKLKGRKRRGRNWRCWIRWSRNSQEGKPRWEDKPFLEVEGLEKWFSMEKHKFSRQNRGEMYFLPGKHETSMRHWGRVGNGRRKKTWLWRHICGEVRRGVEAYSTTVCSIPMDPRTSPGWDGRDPTLSPSWEPGPLLDAGMVSTGLMLQNQEGGPSFLCWFIAYFLSFKA